VRVNGDSLRNMQMQLRNVRLVETQSNPPCIDPTPAVISGPSYLVDPFGELCSHLDVDVTVDVRIGRDDVSVVDEQQLPQCSSVVAVHGGSPRRQRLRTHQPQLRRRPLFITARRHVHRTGWSAIHRPWSPGVRRGCAVDCVLTEREATGQDRSRSPPQSRDSHSIPSPTLTARLTCFMSL